MVRLALLWHMHQPNYEDRATGEHVLPWVRMHAIKDYVGMVALLEEFPRVKVTFNLVPSLLVQVLAFAEERAKDRLLAIGLAPAEGLSADDRRFLIANGFHAPFDRMIAPYRRYAELHARRLQTDAFTTADLRDLQVWHKLAWIDPDWLHIDKRLRALVDRSRDFSESDKATLREVELELLRAVIPAYSAAARRGQVELSTSPFYHPILPLLCDTDAHLAAHPHSAIPHGLLRRPEDAQLQLARAIDLHTTLFGAAPRGIWPSEGSVSDAAVKLIAETGCEWMATDEAILARSLRRAITPGALYRPYEIGTGKTIRCLFRDHGLSDLIGFSYQSWDAAAAAADFIARLRDAGRRFANETSSREVPVISVILDGENAWEHYPGGGRPFLRALYAGLQAAADIQTVTCSEASADPARRLESVFPGSWINGDFYIWAGHRDDQRAWGQLAEARTVLERHASAPKAMDALEELLIAEGSDWFWWYGDDHSSEHDREFDDLFRRHLRHAYEALDQPVPPGLYITNITTEPLVHRVEPTAWLAPVLDGRLTSFGEWAGAVSIALGGGGGTMHRVASEWVRELRVGVGPGAVFLRIDGPELVRELLGGRLGLSLLVGKSDPRRLPAFPAHAGNDVRTAINVIAELGIPLEAVAAKPGDTVSLSVVVSDAEGHVIEQHPAGEPIELTVPEADLENRRWRI